MIIADTARRMNFLVRVGGVCFVLVTLIVYLILLRWSYTASQAVIDLSSTCAVQTTATTTTTRKPATTTTTKPTTITSETTIAR